jgi:hypothetical protein
MKLFRTLASLAGLTGILAASPAFAQGMPDMAMDTGPSALFVGVDILNIALIAASILVLTLVVGRNGKSELSTIFTSFIVAAALLGACRLFILLASEGVLVLSDDAMNMSWHAIFYLAMITFIVGARSLVTLAKEGESHVSNRGLLVWSCAAVAATILVFFQASAISTLYERTIAGSPFESLGGMHIIAFILAGIAAFYVFQRTKVGALTRVLATPFLVSIGLMSVQHFWELLVESWKVIPIPSAIIEQVELIFVVPSYVLFAYAFVRLYRVAVTPAA